MANVSSDRSPTTSMPVVSISPAGARSGTVTRSNAVPRVACVLPPSADFPKYARFAEELGYTRVWAFDSPALYGDVWIALARAAEATECIGLATGVDVPFSRHVMVTASAIASVAELAPGRLACAFGTGFSAAKALGRKPAK